MTPLEFYRTQATKAQDDAASATLENVRDRCLRAAEAWVSMAERIERTDKMRAAREV